MPCEAPGTSGQSTVPRSIVAFLESEINKSERPFTRDRNEYPNRTVADEVLDDSTPPFLGLTLITPLIPSVVSASQPPTVTANEKIKEGIPSRDVSARPLASIPNPTAHFLLDTYMRRIITQCPIFRPNEVMTCFDYVFNDSHFDSTSNDGFNEYRVIYVLSLVMAISLTTAARAQQAQANTIANGLFKGAMNHISNVCTNNIAGLQALLLLLEYAKLDPTAANVWQLSGFTSQACIDLGLHQEDPAYKTLDTELLDTRRRIFWCTYEMDIAVSAALLRPSYFYHLPINVPFPVENESIHEPELISTHFPAQRIWIFRQIEAEIMSTLFHFQNEPQELASLLDWQEETERRIDSWRQEIYSSATSETDPRKNHLWEEMCIYADIGQNVLLVSLFRPSPRIKNPSSDILMKAFAASVGVSNGYLKQANLGFGNSKYVFHPCNHAFSAAIVFMHVLLRCKEIVASTFSLSEVTSSAASFSVLFDTIAERWPAALRYRDEVEKLMIPAKRDYIEYTVQSTAALPQGSFADQIPSYEHGTDPNTTSAWQMMNTDFGSFTMPDLWDYQSPEFTFPSPIDWNAEFDLEMSGI